jgi:NAD(P)-dependent dehydrogenase (short-subunit alcohol dehydrogenase family)
MISQGTPAAIINTGSKQGITCPPGNTAYNVTKAGVKVLTEGLAHALRNIEGCQVTAHLLVPGSTFTGMTARGRTEKPPGSWMPEQVVDFMVAAMAAGDFCYHLSRQRRDPRYRQPAHPLDSRGHHSQPSRIVAVASGLRNRICPVFDSRLAVSALIKTELAWSTCQSANWGALDCRSGAG